MSTAPSRGIFSAAIDRRAISLRSASPEQRRLARRSKGRHRFLDSEQKQEPVKSIVDGREMVVGRKIFLSFNDGRRKTPGGPCMSMRCVPGLRETSSLSR
ncbi:unnamed protein product [Musa acuminata subsp. burmannicoides]